MLLDLDGTIYFRGRPVPGAAETLAELGRRRVPVRFLSNTESMGVARIEASAGRMGLRVPAADIVTPVVTLRALLAAAPRPRCLILASPDVLAEFASVLAGPDEQRVTHVVVGGWQENLSYRALDRAFRAVRAGAELVALHRSPVSIGPDGEHLDAGAFVTLLEHTTGRTATVVGKPAEALFQAATAGWELPASDLLVVGDDPDTDIAGGRRVGARTALVLTGKSERIAPDAGRRAGADVVLRSVAELPALLDAGLQEGDSR